MLPGELHDELLAVEEAIGAEVGIKALSAKDAEWIRRFDVAAMETGMVNGVAFANLLIPEGEELTAHTVAHEVMHAHRNLAQSVWRLVDASGSANPLPMVIENDIEHLTIIPREMAFFPEAATFWEAEWAGRINDQVEQLRSADQFERMAGKAGALRLWLTLDLIMPAHVGRDRLHEALAGLGSGRDAANILKSYHRAQPRKLDLIAMAVRFAGLPTERFAAQRYLPAERRIEGRSLPS